MTKYILAWIPMVFIAIGNGALRQVWYEKHMGELPAHQVSTASGVILFGIYMWGVIRLWRPESPQQAMAIGFLWLGMTVAFEFLFGHYVAGHSWSRLLHDYNILDGRVWLVVLMWVTMAPYIFFRVQN